MEEYLSKFLSNCERLVQKKVIKLLRKRICECQPEYLTSSDLLNSVLITEAKINTDKKNIYVHLKEFLEEVKKHKEEKSPSSNTNTDSKSTKNKNVSSDSGISLANTGTTLTKDENADESKDKKVNCDRENLIDAESSHVYSVQEKKSINNVGKVPQTYDDYFRKFAERVDTCGSENDSVTSAPSSQEEDNSELSDVEFIIEQDDNQSISISHTDQSFKLSSSFTVFEGSCDGSITSEKSTDEQDQDNDITLISDDSSEEVTMVTEEEEEESENEAELPCQPICSPDSQGMELILGSENDKDNEEDGIRNEDESNEKDGEGKEDRGSENDGGIEKYSDNKKDKGCEKKGEIDFDRNSESKKRSKTVRGSDKDVENDRCSEVGDSCELLFEVQVNSEEDEAIVLSTDSDDVKEVTVCSNDTVKKQHDSKGVISSEKNSKTKATGKECSVTKKDSAISPNKNLKLTVIGEETGRENEPTTGNVENCNDTETKMSNLTSVVQKLKNEGRKYLSLKRTRDLNSESSDDVKLLESSCDNTVKSKGLRAADNCVDDEFSEEKSDGSLELKMTESVNKSVDLKEDKDKNNSHYENNMEVNNAIEQASYSGSTSTQDITLHTNKASDVTEEMETSFSGSASTPDFKHQISNSDIEKKRDDHSDIEKERGGHSDTDKKREGHSEFDKKREGQSDIEKKREGHSDTDKKREGHFEAEKTREGHSVAEKKREGHSDTDKKREGHSDTDKKREGHSEAEKKREGHSDTDKKREGHSDTDKNRECHSGTDKKREGYSEAEKKEEKQETKERKKGSKGQIRKLEKLLEDIKDKIEELKQREVSLDEMDDDDSAYIMEDRYQKKFVKVWNKLCEVKGRTPKTGRPSEKKFTYSGTRFPEINRKIESFINKTKKFPDFHDIRQVITKVNHRCKLGMRSSAVEKEAREVFTDVGDKLQRRRQADLLVTFGGHLTNTSDLSSSRDPATADQELKRKLDDSRKVGLRKLNEVMEKYVNKQYDREKEEECSSSNDNNTQSDDNNTQSDDDSNDENVDVPEMDRILNDTGSARQSIEEEDPRESTASSTKPVENDKKESIVSAVGLSPFKTKDKDVTVTRDVQKNLPHKGNSNDITMLDIGEKNNINLQAQDGIPDKKLGNKSLSLSDRKLDQKSEKPQSGKVLPPSKCVSDTVKHNTGSSRRVVPITLHNTEASKLSSGEDSDIEIISEDIVPPKLTISKFSASVGKKRPADSYKPQDRDSKRLKLEKVENTSTEKRQQNHSVNPGALQKTNTTKESVIIPTKYKPVSPTAMKSPTSFSIKQDRVCSASQSNLSPRPHQATQPNTPTNMSKVQTTQRKTPTNTLKHQTTQPKTPTNMLKHQTTQPKTPTNMLKHQTTQPKNPTNTLKFQKSKPKTIHSENKGLKLAMQKEGKRGGESYQDDVGENVVTSSVPSDDDDVIILD